MKERILAFLKTNNKLVGVQDSYLLGVAELYSKTITDETQIATTFTDGVVDLLKFNAGLLQTEGDRRITQAKLDLKAWQEKYGLDENGKPIEDPKKKKSKEVHDPDEPAWFTEFKKTQQSTIDELKNKIEAQEKQKTTDLLAGKVKSHDKLKGIPASFLKGRNLIPESEDKIDQLVIELETDWNTFKQEQAEQGVHISIPQSSDGVVKEGEVKGKEAAKARNKESSAVNTDGKKL